jgi:hypothetical protein
MISIRCPHCSKLLGFEEADAGVVVACAFCRQPFFLPPVAIPTAGRPPEPPVPQLLPPLVLPEELELAPDTPHREGEPSPAREVPDEALPELAPTEETRLAPEPFPHMELDSPEPEPPLDLEIEPPTPEEPGPASPPAEAITEAAPALAPPADEAAPEVHDVLEEVGDDQVYSALPATPPRGDEDEGDGPATQRRKAGRRPERSRRTPIEDDEEERPKPRRRKRPRPAEPAWPDWLTRNRLVGGVATLMGGVMLLGTLSHHLSGAPSAWHYGICCGDGLGAALLGMGVYFLAKG